MILKVVRVPADASGMDVDEAIDALLDARAEAGLASPVAEGDDAAVDALIAAVAPQRLPADLERLWRRIDAHTLGVEAVPTLEPPDRALETWRMLREESFPDFDCFPVTLLHFASYSHSFLAVELDHEGVVGDAVFDGDLADSHVGVRARSVVDWLRYATAELRAGRFSRSESRGQERVVLSSGWTGTVDHPRFPATMSLFRDDGDWPASWCAAADAHHRRMDPAADDDWHVRLTSSSKDLEVGGTVSLTASVTPALRGDRELAIVEDGCSDALAMSRTGDTCSARVSLPYAANSRASGVRRFRAEVRGRDTGDVVVHADLSVVEVRWSTGVRLRVSETGDGGLEAQAETCDAVTGTGYAIRILRDDETVVGHAGTGTTATAADLERGHRYRAVVEDGQGWAFASSASWTVPESGPPVDHAAGAFDLLGVAARFGTGAEVCDAAHRAASNVVQEVADAYRDAHAAGREVVRRDPDATPLEVLTAVSRADGPDGGAILGIVLTMPEGDRHGALTADATEDPGGSAGGTARPHLPDPRWLLLQGVPPEV